MNQWEILALIQEINKPVTCRLICDLTGEQKDLVNKKLCALARYGYLERVPVGCRQYKYNLITR